MKLKTFKRVFIGILALCVVLTLAHMIYLFYAYQHSSIIYFVAKELW